jgi:hypothetical protein
MNKIIRNYYNMKINPIPKVKNIPYELQIQSNYLYFNIV